MGKREKEIGQRIRQARLDASARRGKVFSQVELAKALGVSSQTVSQWETGASKPELENFPIIAKALGVSAALLAFGEAAAVDAAPAIHPDNPIPKNGTLVAVGETVKTESRRQKPTPE